MMSFGPWNWVNPGGLRPPPLVTVVLLDQLERSGAGPTANWVEQRRTVTNIPWESMNFGPADMAPVPEPGANRLQLIVAWDISPHKQIAHSLCGLTAAVIGALAGYLIAARGRREAALRSE